MFCISHVVLLLCLVLCSARLVLYFASLMLILHVSYCISMYSVVFCILGCVFYLWATVPVSAKHNTVNPRLSPLGAYLFLAFLDGGLFEGGAYTRGGL